MRQLALYTFLTLHTVLLQAQVYNQEHLSHFNTERNPSYCAFSEMSNSVGNNNSVFIHKEKLATEYSLRVNHYFSRFFAGAGLVAGTAKMDDTSTYSYAGLALGYRNVLFDAVYIRAGVCVKYLTFDAGTEYYPGYEYGPAQSSTGLNNLINLNLVFSVSSPSDNLHCSFGVLNYVPGGSEEDRKVFPMQQFVNIGNITRLFFEDKSLAYRWFFSAYRNTLTDGEFGRPGYGTTLLKYFRVNRNTSFFAGIGGGLREERYISLGPQFMYDFSISFIGRMLRTRKRGDYLKLYTYAEWGFDHSEDNRNTGTLIHLKLQLILE